MLIDDTYWLIIQQIDELREFLDERNEHLHGKGLSVDYTEKVLNRSKILYSFIENWHRMAKETTYYKSF